MLSPTFLADVDATVMAEQDPEPGVDFNGSMASDKVGLCRLALEAREAPAKVTRKPQHACYANPR